MKLYIAFGGDDTPRLFTTNRHAARQWQAYYKQPAYVIDAQEFDPKATDDAAPGPDPEPECWTVVDKYGRSLSPQYFTNTTIVGHFISFPHKELALGFKHMLERCGMTGLSVQKVG